MTAEDLDATWWVCSSVLVLHQDVWSRMSMKLGRTALHPYESEWIAWRQNSTIHRLGQEEVDAYYGEHGKECLYRSLWLFGAARIGRVAVYRFTVSSPPHGPSSSCISKTSAKIPSVRPCHAVPGYPRTYSQPPPPAFYTVPHAASLPSVYPLTFSHK